jgi:hypothetical protein
LLEFQRFHFSLPSPHVKKKVPKPRDVIVSSQREKHFLYAFV